MSRETVFEEINAERDRQNRIWLLQDGEDIDYEFDNNNTPNDWVAYITRYVAEGAYDGREHSYSEDRFREHLIKAAALCVAAVETLDREGACAARHYDKQ